MKKMKKLFAVMMTLALMLVFIPSTAMAVDDSDSSGVVIVTVSNTTYDGAPEDRQGEFLREEVQLTSGMTVAEAIDKACENAGIPITYNNGLVDSIGGLGSNSEALASGWFCAVNNWFADKGTSEILAQDGDWISLEYTNRNSWDVCGADVGSVWGDFTKTLKSLDFDSGKLTPVFSIETTDYTLSIPEGTEGVVVSPLATNRNFMVKTFVGSTEYKLFDVVPVSDGTEITVICGDPEWASMNKPDDTAAVTYTITINMEEAVVDDNDTEDISAESAVDKSPKTGDADMVFPLIMLITLGGVGMATVARRRTN